jgi:hypothetical protein
LQQDASPFCSNIVALSKDAWHDKSKPIEPTRGEVLGQRQRPEKHDRAGTRFNHGLSRSAVKDDVELEMLASANTACLEQQAISSVTMDLVRSRLRLRDIRDHRHEMFTALYARAQKT